MRRLPVLARMPLGIAVAAAAGIVAVLLMAPIADTGPFWVQEMSISIAAASAWMVAGVAVTGRNPAAAPAIFLAGAGAAWLLSRGIVHSVSPYYGLFSFTIACATGSLIWFALVRRSARLSARLVALVLPVLLAGIVVAFTLGSPAPGVTRRLTTADSKAVDVSMIVVAHDGRESMYLWIERGRAIETALRDAPVLLEPDPGSGEGRYRLAQVRDASEIRELCDRLQADARQRIEREVGQGYIPRFVTRVPVRFKLCERGSIWLARSG